MNESRKEIVNKAWALIQEDFKLKKIYFFPGLISIIFLTILLVYQFVYTYVVLLNKKEAILVIILEIFHSKYLVELLMVFGIFLIIYFLITPIFEGGLIHYLDKKNNGKNVRASEIVGAGIYKFLPMFEYSNIFSEFKFISIVNIYLFCLRFIGIEYIGKLNYLFFFLLILSMIINIISAYSKFEIILNDKKALESVASSMKIALFNIGTTVRVYFFLFIVNIRIILNFFVFLFFPFIIVSAITYITSKIFLAVTITILGIIFFALIMLLGYLGGVFEIFKTAVWYYAYLEGKENLKSDGHDNHGSHDDHGDGGHGHDEHHH